MTLQIRKIFVAMVFVSFGIIHRYLLGMQSSAASEVTISPAYLKVVKAATGGSTLRAAHYLTGTTPDGMAFVPYGIPTRLGNLHDRLYDYTIVAATGLSSLAHISQSVVDRLCLKEINVGADLKPTSPAMLCKLLKAHYHDAIIPALYAAQEKASSQPILLPTERELATVHDQLLVSINVFAQHPTWSMIKHVDDLIYYFDAISYTVGPYLDETTQ